MKMSKESLITKSLPKMDMCQCDLCGWSGKVSECEVEWERDGWEYPEYQIHLCPKCDDGYMVEYWYSEESLNDNKEVFTNLIQE